MTPIVSEPAKISSGGYAGDVNLFSGAYSSSIPLGTVATPGGLSYSLNLNYSPSFSVGNTSPVSKGIPYGDGWNLTIPTVSIESEVFNTFSNIAYCQENSPGASTPLNYTNAGDQALNEGDLFWYSPYIQIPGVASGRAVFKYVDENDNKTVVFELNTFETHVEVRYSSGGWTIITADGTIYELNTAIQSFNAPANKRVLNYDVSGSPGNQAWSVAANGYISTGTSGIVANSISPKQRYNLWYCNAIRHKNKPLQSIVFFYQGFGKFNYFKEFDQEAYKYAASTLFGNSTFSMEHDFSCYSDLLLTKVESYSISGLVNRLDLKYETEKSIISANPELIPYNTANHGRLDSLYSYQSVVREGMEDNNFSAGWHRYKHSKSSTASSSYPVNPVNPYLVNSTSYLRNAVTPDEDIPFDHSFLESPRLLSGTLVPGDIYEVKTRISRSNPEQLKNGNSTIDVSIVSGTLDNQDGTANNAFNLYNNNTSGSFFDKQDYDDSRGISLFSTFNMALKWTLSYSENLKQTSNLFVMPNLPTRFHGFNIQVGPGNSDMSYEAAPSTVYDSLDHASAEKAYYYRYGSSIKPVADINPNFGVGFPWAMMIPIYKQMVTSLNAIAGTVYSPQVFNTWYNLDNSSGTPWVYDNVPTKMDHSVKLEELEVIRYSKNPYVLKYVALYAVNGDVGGLTETGLHLIAKKKLEYTSAREKILENYAYQFGQTLQYKSNVMQVFVLLSKVRELPIDGQTDTTLLPTTFFSYETFKNAVEQYDINYPLSGHTGKVLNKITDHLGGITKIEYYSPTFTDSRTIYHSTLTYKKNCSGVSSPPLYGLSSAVTVNPVVKTILKNDEDDLVKTNAASTHSGHQKWTYDFDASSKVYKQTQMEVNHPNFFNTRSASYDVGFKTVTVYGPSLIEGGNEFINKTIYEHHGYKNSSGSGTPAIEDYLYHGKLKSIKEYDVSNKLFTEKLIHYEYTLAYQNGYERPNPVKEDLVWEQQYDNPGGQYEYRDYYLDQPLIYIHGSNAYVGAQAYKYLDIPVFNGSGEARELPKSMEFYFYPQLKANPNNPEYLFHSYFIKKKEEINRKYDDYLYKQAVISGVSLPAPVVFTGPNPFGSGFTNPVVFDATVAAAQINLIINKPAPVIMDELMQAPLMDTVLYHVIQTSRLTDVNKISLLLAQGNLSNLTLDRFITKFGPIRTPDLASNAVIQQQSYISDDVLLATLPKITNRWNLSFVSSLLQKNDYLSDQVVVALADSRTGYFDPTLFKDLLSKQPQFSENAITKIVKSRYLTPSFLSAILKNQAITEDNYSTIIRGSDATNTTIVEIIESGGKYPTELVFNWLLARSPAFSVAEMERIIAVADRDIERSVLTKLINKYGNRPFLTGFSFTGNPLDAYCYNAVQSGWNYIETTTSYEYYEADYKGTSNGRAYKVLMGLEDIPGRTVSSTDVFGSGGTKTVNSLRLKHEPSWQVFSVTTSSAHLPTAKDEKQYFYLYDLKNRYDRYWYNYDVKTTGGIGTSFDTLLMNNKMDTLMYTTRWNPAYVETYQQGIAPESPKYDGMTKSRQYGMRSTPFQQTHITKNQRDSKALSRSEYYFYDSRWKVDPFSVLETVEYNGPSCPGIGTPPADPVGCESCMRWKYGTEEEFVYNLPFNYCLWKDPVVGYYACPSSINYALCNNGVELISCNPGLLAEEEHGPTKMILLTDALKKSLQLRSTIVQVDTLWETNGISNDFAKRRFDRSNTQVADFYIGNAAETDDQQFIYPYRMLFPYDTLTTARVHKRNEHLQPALISNQVGLQTKFHYRTTRNKWNVDTNCTNPHYSFLYNYSSVETFDIGLPVRVTVGYTRPDSLVTTFEYTHDGQVKKMTTSSGHVMEYAFDGFNRLKSVTENGSRLLSRNEYQYWKHDFSKTFKQRTDENYVYSVLYQNSTDTLTSREFQKAFLDPLGRTAGVVKAYRGEGAVQISSGSVDYDNWGRARIQRKPSVFTDSNPVTDLNPILFKYNAGSALYRETAYENDPISLDTKHADPGESISGWNVVSKKTAITNAIYLSCELRLNRTELDLIMNGSTGSFRFLRTWTQDQDGKESISYTNALGQTVATFASANMAENVRTLYVYDSYGNLVKTINGERQPTDYQYNMNGQLIRETNVDGGEKRYIYNKHGKISGVQDQLDRQHVNASHVPAPRFRKFEYDAYGNLLEQTLVVNPYHLDPFCFENKTLGSANDVYTDSAGNPHYFEYVFSNRMTQDWLNQYHTLSPLNLSAITTSGLPVNAMYSTVIQEKSLVYGTAQSSPSTLGKLVTSYSYPPSAVNTNSIAIQKITYAYNAEDLLASQVIIQHPTNIALNDQFLVKATIQYPTYNFRGSLLHEKLDMGSDGTVEMAYFYSYDELNRLEKVSVAQGDVPLANATTMASYKYDDARGMVVSKKYLAHNGSNSLIENQVVDYSYDQRDRLAQLGGTLFNERLYYDDELVPGYNNQMSVIQDNAFNGNIKGIRSKYNFSGASDSIPLFAKETVYAYQYDRVNRLVSSDALVGDFIDAQFGNGSNPNPTESYSIGDESMGYDRIGNIIGQHKVLPGALPNAGSTIDHIMYTYANGTNRLTKVADQVTGIPRNYTYDANGNLLTDDYRHITATGYMRGSYPHRVTQVSQGMEEYSEYLYDNADQRISKKTVTSAQTMQEMYIKDALGRDLSIVTFTTSGGTTASATEYFVYGTDRVARVTSSGTGAVPARVYFDEATFFLYDHLGNTRVAFQVNGSNVPVIVNALDYFSYGKILREYSNSTAGGDRYLTTQHERDKKTGLDYRGARYYDSDIARFLSTDPWANKYPAWSTYNYVMGNPLRLIDPTGKGPTDWFLNVQTGNLVYVKGKSEITQTEIDKYGWNSSTSDYKRLGADNMFGDKVSWGNTNDVLAQDVYSFYNYTEYFMETEGYVKGREYSVKETESTTGGRQGDENVEHSQYTYEATKGDLTYVKPDELNQREKFKDYKDKGFCWKKTTVTYNTVAEYGTNPRSNTFFSSNNIGDNVSLIADIVTVIGALFK